MGGMDLSLVPNLGGGGSANPVGPLASVDEFTTARNAGAVNGTDCEPWGDSKRTVVDTENKITIADGKLIFAGGKASPAYGDPGYWRTTAITRAAGVIGAAKIMLGDVTSIFQFGFDTSASGAISENGFVLGTDILAPLWGATGPVVAIPTDSTEITLAVVLRAAGAHFFRRIGTGNFEYLYSTPTRSTATLYLGFAGYSQAFQADWMRKPFLKWLPSFLVSDGFNAADATSNDGRLSDGLGHAETTGLGASGSGVAWSGASGSIVSNRLVITPTLGVELNSGDIVVGNWYQITATQANFFYTACAVDDTFKCATAKTLSADNKVKLITLATIRNSVTLATRDIEIKAAFTMVTGLQAGVVFGMNTAGTSFIIAYHNGAGKIIMDICIEGTYTNKESITTAYGADKELRVRRVGQAIWVYYGDVLQDAASGPSTTLSEAEDTALSGLKCGLFSTSSENSFAYATVMPVGTGGEHNFLKTLVETGEPSNTIYDIGIPGMMGFAVGAYRGELPSGFTALVGSSTITSDNYGNYQYSDGSIMCWIPKFYYKIGDGFDWYKDHIDVKSASYFANTTAANAAGYALHRAFIDGGEEKDGFFIDKYECSKNALGTGYVASSIVNGKPISTASAHNPIADLTATSGVNYYYSAIVAPKARDGINGAVNSSSIFHCASRFQYAALAMLSLAHGQASQYISSANAWYNSTSNFPKGNNDNALKDTNDTSVIYTTDGYSNCGKTGSGAPISKTTHNGQPSGVCDLNGNMYEISIGATCIAVSTNITGITQANPGVITAAGHGLVAGSYVQFASIGGMTQLNDKIFVVSWADTDTFTLYAANGTDSLDTSAFGAYTSGGTATRGVFYVAKETTAMKNFTGGTTLATDHWGETGCAAMMSAFAPVFETAYPNNVFAQRFGDSTGRVLSGDTSGAGWTLSGLGLPAAVSGISTSGTAAFGTDYFYQYIRNDFCLRSGGYWGNGSGAGVWHASWNNSRSNSNVDVGFRAATYGE